MRLKGGEKIKFQVHMTKACKTESARAGIEKIEKKRIKIFKCAEQLNKEGT